MHVSYKDGGIRQGSAESQNQQNVCSYSTRQK